MVIQRLDADLAAVPVSPLVLVEWVYEDGSRRVHAWATYLDLAQAHWSTHGAWVLATADTPAPENPAADLIWEIVSGAGHDALLIFRALLQTAPSTEAVEFVGAGLEDLFKDERVDDAAIAAMRAWVQQDARWALAASNMWISEDTSDSRKAVMSELGARRPSDPSRWHRR